MQSRFSPAGHIRLFVLGVGLLVFLPLAWYLGSPLFIDQAVDEAFPTAIVRQSSPTGAAMLPPTITATAATAIPTPQATATANAVVAPVQPSAITTAVPTPPPPTYTPIPPPSPTPSPTPLPAGPLVLSSGQFTVVDTIHRGEGTVTLFRLPDGRHVLRFENFRVTNGPDLFVYLSGHPAPRSSSQLHAVADYEVARLKGNSGNQNYDLPLDLDISRFKSVVIYCKQFTTVFSTAELR